jgi:hypothetical protein
MATRYIYLPDELNNKLRNEENASGLIQELLTRHYSISIKLPEKKEIIEQNILNLTKEAVKIEQEIKDMDEIELKLRRERDEVIRQEKERKYSDPKYWERIKVMMRSLFSKYDIEKGSFEPFLEEFMTLLQEKKIKNAEEFMELKGIKKKEVKENEKSTSTIIE